MRDETKRYVMITPKLVPSIQKYKKISAVRDKRHVRQIELYALRSGNKTKYDEKDSAIAARTRKPDRNECQNKTIRHSF